MYTEQRSAGSIEELRKYIGDKYATKRRFGEIDSHPIYCKFESDPARECRFLPVATDWNACYALNPASVADVFNAPIFAEGLYTAHNISGSSYKMANNSADLTVNKMSMILDRTRWKIGSGVGGGGNDFIVDVNAKSDYFDVSTNGFDVARVGYETTVHVTPRELVSQDNLATLAGQNRA